MHCMKRFLAAVAVLGLVAAAAQAGTIGYWRFEGSDFLGDSGPDGLALTTTGTAPSQLTLPATGAGSMFYDPVPAGANVSAANFGTSQAGNFRIADTAALTVSDFTIEALVNRAATSANPMFIASQWSTATGFSNQRSWSLYIDAAGQLIVALSSSGSTASTFVSGMTLALNTDYYVGASFDLSDQADGLTFYVKNLTDGGAMQTVSFAHTLSALHNSTARFEIGTYNSSQGDRRWKGVIDEVRLSNEVLPPSQLLPEPATLALLGMGAATLVFRRRRA